MSSTPETGMLQNDMSSILRITPVSTTVTVNSYGPIVSTSVEDSAVPEQGEDQEEEAELKYGAGHVINLFVPVSLCMVMVVFTMNTVTFYSQNDGRHLLYTPFVKETDSASEKVLMSLGNALVMLCVVVVMTVVLIFFYKYRCYKLIHGWLMASSCLLLFLFTTIYLQEVMKSFNISPSVFTVGFFLGNFGVLGMMCIHWKGPLRLQQFYLITMSALMALVFIKYLPEWTVWSVLAVISIWDLIAVLAPNGPLRILVETAQERNEPIFPALIYSSGMMYSFIFNGALEGEANSTNVQPSVQASSSEESTPSTSGLLTHSSSSVARVRRFAPQRNPVVGNLSQEAVRSLNDAPILTTPRVQPNLVPRDQEESKRNGIIGGVKLGLGDFIFYSVLVGKASSYFDWNTTVACYVAILVGLCFTLVLLAVFRRALPALPISIFAGLLFYFSTRWIVTPYVSELTRRQWIY
ncbi:presenilin-1 [Dictyocaulus viviparus]|uniref:Presenilin n=1 Tax=Dictyocaulus viviparus TaxID=29172 RepID=A0A0D8XGM7_DICVI|nr:presenilin-1 [Dictyocaulus viviparus]